MVAHISNSIKETTRNLVSRVAKTTRAVVAVDEFVVIVVVVEVILPP